MKEIESEIIKSPKSKEPSIFSLKLLPIINGVEEPPIFCEFISPVLKIGRIEGNDVILPIQTASRFHAELSIENGQIFIRDLNSSHGTFIGQSKLPPFEKRELINGDLIRFSTENNWFEVCFFEGENVSKEIPDQFENEEKTERNDLDFEFANREEEISKTKSKWEIYKSLVKGQKKGKAVRKTTSKELDWGLIDVEEELESETEQDKVLDTQLMRLLPNLTDEQLRKIDNFEKKLKALHQLESTFENLEKKIRSLEKKEMRVDDSNYFEEENFESKNQRHGEAETKTGTYKLWDTRQKINKKLSELGLMEDQLRSSIFGKIKATNIAKENQNVYEENTKMIDKTKDENLTKNDNKKLNEEDLIKTKTEDLGAKLQNLIKKKLFIEENLVNSSFDNSANEFDFLDEYEAFLSENKEMSKLERKSKLLKDLKEIETEIQDIYLKFKNENQNFQGLAVIEQRVKFELKQVIFYLKQKQKAEAAKISEPQNNLAEEIDEADYLNDEEEIMALRKRSSKPKNPNRTDPVQNKAAKRIGVFPNFDSNGQVIEFQESIESKHQYGFSLVEQQKTEDYFKKLGY